MKSENRFSDRTISTLTSLVGRDFSFIAGPGLSTYLVSDLMFIVGTEYAIEVVGSLTELEVFDEGSEEYGSIAAKIVTRGEVDASVRQENIFLRHGQQIILNVHVLTETIQKISNGAVSGEFTDDVGFVIELEAGLVCFTKLGHGAEVFEVTYPNALSTSDLKPVSTWFEDDIHHHYETNRTLRKLGL